MDSLFGGLQNWVSKIRSEFISSSEWVCCELCSNHGKFSFQSRNERSLLKSLSLPDARWCGFVSVYSVRQVSLFSRYLPERNSETIETGNIRLFPLLHFSSNFMLPPCLPMVDGWNQLLAAVQLSCYHVCWSRRLKLIYCDFEWFGKDPGRKLITSGLLRKQNREEDGALIAAWVWKNKTFFDCNECDSI